MKNILKSLLAVLVLFLGACSQDHTSTIFEPTGELANEIYFVSNGFAVEYEATETTGEVFVDLYRANAVGAVDVALSAEFSSGADAFITVPATASFQDGEYKVSVPITFNNISSFVRGVSYSVTLSQNTGTGEITSLKKLSKDGASTKAIDTSFKLPAITVSASLKLEWEPVYILKDWNNLFVDPATLTDDAYVLDAEGKKQIQGGVFTYTYWWGGDDDTVTLERAKGTNVFRMTNWGGGVEVVMNVDTTNTFTDENGVAHPTFSTPITFIGSTHSSYGQVFASSMEAYGPKALWDKYQLDMIPCYFDIANGVFYCYYAYTVGAGLFGVSGIDTDVETFVLNSGIVVYDYATAAEYKGMEVGPDNAAANAKLSVKTGKDATGFTYALVNEDISKDFASVAAAIVAGTQDGAVSVTELGEEGVTEVVVENLVGGPYTIVVVAHDKDKNPTVDGASAAYFYFPGLGGGVKECEFTATLGSYEALGLEFVDGVGDWSAVAIDFASEDLKSLVYFVADKATLDTVLAQEGVTAEVVLAEYGVALTEEQIAAIKTNGSIKVPFTGLKANAEQTLLALGTNSFGKSLLVTASGATVDYPAYSGKVKPGTYKLSCPWVSETTGNSGVDEATLTILPVKGYKNKFMIADMLTAAPQEIAWNAYYDEVAGTLTVDGTMFGYEAMGVVWGKVFNIFVYDAEGKYMYGLFAGDDRKGSEFAMTINDNGEPVGIASGKGISIILLDAASGQQATYYEFNSVNTTIAPYEAPAEGEGEGEGAQTQSLKKAAKAVSFKAIGQVPFSSIRR